MRLFKKRSLVSLLKNRQEMNIKTSIYYSCLKMTKLTFTYKARLIRTSIETNSQRRRLASKTLYPGQRLKSKSGRGKKRK